MYCSDSELPLFRDHENAEVDTTDAITASVSRTVGIRRFTDPLYWSKQRDGRTRQTYYCHCPRMVAYRPLVESSPPDPTKQNTTPNYPRRPPNPPNNQTSPHTLSDPALGRFHQHPLQPSAHAGADTKHHHRRRDGNIQHRSRTYDSEFVEVIRDISDILHARPGMQRRQRSDEIERGAERCC